MTKIPRPELEMALEDVRRALHIKSTKEDYNRVVRAYSEPVEIHIPIGELVGNLAGFAWVWEKRGHISKPLPITEKDSFNAQGLEGKVIVTGSTYYDALIVASQTTLDRINVYRVGKTRSNPAGSGIRIVYNKLLSGWYIVRGPHQTPLNGRFNSKAEAQAWLARPPQQRANPGRNGKCDVIEKQENPVRVRGGKAYRVSLRGNKHVVARDLGAARIPFIFVAQAGANTVGDVPVQHMDKLREFLEAHPNYEGRFARYVLNAKQVRKNPTGGFYVMKYGGGRYTSVAWFLTREQAQAEVDRIKRAGAWSGMPPKIEPS